MHIAENKLSPDLTLVFRALPGLYLLLSPDYIILDITKKYASLINLSVEEAIGKYIFDAYPADDNDLNNTTRQELRVSLRHAKEHKEPHTMPSARFDVPVPAAAGGGFEEKYWTTTNTPILDYSGELLYILHETEDITEKVQQEQIHKKNEERLNMLDNALPTVSWEYDIVNDQLSWDKNLFHVFGYAPEELELTGVSWDKLVHPDDFKAVQQSITQATKQGQKIWTGEYRLKKADGTYVHVLDQGYYVYDSNNKPLRTFGTIIDLSLSKRTEESLKESDTRFRQLLENLPHMAGLADPKGKVLYFNDNWYSYTGMPKGQTDGWTSVIHPEDTAEVLTAWHKAISSGNMFEVEYRIRDYITGNYRYFLKRGMPMHDSNGNLTLWVTTCTDIDDQRQNFGSSLRLKEQQLESMLQFSPAHLCLLEGPKHVCRYVSPGVYRMYGARPYIGKPAHELWPELEQTKFLDLLNLTYTQGEVTHLDAQKLLYDRYQDGKPEEAYFNLKYQPIFDQYSQVEGVLISAVEVTELIQEKRKAKKLAAALNQKIS
ncbi:PAS domain-containing protein [Pontibacter sp. H249]|uniref:PAS domain-containing protein n=1 Tax=Pontibacter sp. H249 TaxID=3133420 RepID=UPI0030BE7301